MFVGMEGSAGGAGAGWGGVRVKTLQRGLRPLLRLGNFCLGGLGGWEGGGGTTAGDVCGSCCDGCVVMAPGLGALAGSGIVVMVAGSARVARSRAHFSDFRGVLGSDVVLTCSRQGTVQAKMRG